MDRPASERTSSAFTWHWYVDGTRQRAELERAVEQARAGRGFLWFGLRDPDEAMMAELGDLIDLHQLAAADVIEGHRRSKLEMFDDHLFLVVSTVDYVEHEALTETSEIVSTGEIMLFLGSWYVVTARRGGRAQLRELRSSLESDPREVAMGPWRVLYRVLDAVIDDFAETVTEMEADVEEAEAVVFARNSTHEVERSYQLKRELIEFKRCVFPLQAPLSTLVSRPPDVLPTDLAAPYFRELSNHLQAVRESVAALDEVLGTILQAALARASVADNQDVRKISAAVAILAVPTTIGAIYGMNFTNMPELETKNGYFVVLGVMATLMFGLFLAFRRFRWL